MLTPSRKMGEALQFDEPAESNFRVETPVVLPSPDVSTSNGPASNLATSGFESGDFESDNLEAGNFEPGTLPTLALPTTNQGLPRQPAAGRIQIDSYLISRPSVSSKVTEGGDSQSKTLHTDQSLPKVIESTEFMCGLAACEEIGRPALETMSYLLKAHDYARTLGVDVWDFAVEIDCLRRLGIGATELRWLVGSGWTQQAQETTAAGDDRRMFSRGGFLTFDAQTCFVLTEAGVAAARCLSRSVSAPELSDEVETKPTESGRPATLEKPKWIADRQELYFGGELVKQFKLPSPNQIAILSAFEEEAWPTHVDDPLPMSSSVGPKERLRYTIKSLNKHQKKRRLRFRGDGRGEGICWEVWEHATSL